MKDSRQKKNQIQKLGSQSRSALIMCSDYRFWPATIKYIKETYNPAMMDLETNFGGPEKLAVGTNASHVALNELAISDIFHQLDEVFLVIHQDCEVYEGGSVSFESPEAEEADVRKDLQVAADKILQHHPKLKVIRLFAYFDVEDVKFKELN